MAELHSNIYFKHPKQAVHNQLLVLFSLGDINSRIHISDTEKFRLRFLQLAKQINPDQGQEIATALLQDFDQKYGETFSCESIWEDSGYCISHWVNGSQGQYIAGRMVKFLYQLCPDIHAQAWGCGDDDPWEYWYKFEDGHVITHEDEPDMDDDSYIENTIYRWWHESMPDSIREGILNERDEEEDDEEYLDPSDQTGEVNFSEEDYQQWLAHQKNTSGDENDQGIESPISTEDVKEFMGLFKTLFSAASGPKVSSSSALQEMAPTAESLNKQIVLNTFQDMNQAEANRDIDGVMKHFSPKLTGKCRLSESNELIVMPVNYSVIKLNMKMLLNPKADFKSTQKNIVFDQINSTQAVLHFENKAVYQDPSSGNRVVTRTREAYTYALIDSRIQIIESNSEEISTLPAE